MPVPQPARSTRRSRRKTQAKRDPIRAFDTRSGADPLTTLAHPTTGIPLAQRRQAQNLAYRGPASSTSAQAAFASPLRMAHPLQMPTWVRYATWWRQTTTGVAIFTCAITTGLYSWTVYTQHRWSVQYEALEQMQRHDRQFQLTQESMANSLRETATRGEMVPLVPDRMIDVPIIPAEGIEIPPAPAATATQQIRPVGY
ncbi:MAG: hypothetical protein HC818_01830 [Synechococcaceae cyanobacterium RM1_1_27]|nr:hypothetical protein [Synechococcaceae cyanobacterium SM2_3_2]NJO85565.1 hypothetical protein [Synechococcaceae cyanobacterium RM1_1_27]